MSMFCKTYTQFYAHFSVDCVFFCSYTNKKGELTRTLNEIAGSHIARRTFIANLYSQVKDPNLIGSLSGHTEGSKAFARYRDINIDIKRDLIDSYLD